MSIEFSLAILHGHHGWLSNFAQTSWPILNLTRCGDGDGDRNVECLLLLLLASNELWVVRDLPIKVLFSGNDDDDDDAAAVALVDVVVVAEDNDDAIVAAIVLLINSFDDGKSQQKSKNLDCG